jgi:hypothetical protein
VEDKHKIFAGKILKQFLKLIKELIKVEDSYEIAKPMHTFGHAG